MKILIISGSYPPCKCGVGDYSKKLFEGIKNKFIKKIDLTLLTSKCYFNSYGKKVDLVNGWNIKNLNKTIKLIMKEHFDIVNLQFPTQSYRKSIGIVLLIIFMRIKKIKIVTTLHEYSFSSRLAKIRTFPILLCSSYIIAVDKTYIKDIKNKWFLKNKRCEFLNIASNIPLNNLNDSNRELFKKEIILDEKCNLVLGYFGFVNKNKGIELVIKTLKKLVQDNKYKCKLILICTLDSNNKYQRDILNYINNNDLEKYIKITGHLDEQKVANTLSICDYIILPFRFGLSSRNGSYLAALKQNVKIITTIPNQINEEVYNNTLFIKQEDDELQIVKLIEETISQVPVIQYTFNEWTKICDRYVQLFQCIEGEF